MNVRLSILSSFAPFLIVCDKEHRVTLCSDAVTRRFSDIVGMKLDEVISLEEVSEGEDIKEFLL